MSDLSRMSVGQKCQYIVINNFISVWQNGEYVYSWGKPEEVQRLIFLK
jgi:hypothetical protein